MIKKKLFIFLIIFFSISSFSFSFSIEPDIFVQSTVNRASKLLGEDISKNEKIEKLKLIAKETVDIKGIGFYTLGVKRKSLSGDEKERYSKLFEEYFLKSFSSRLAEYTNPEIDVTNKEISNLLNVQYQTTLLIFKNNEEIYRSVGETTEDLIYEAIKSSI